MGNEDLTPRIIPWYSAPKLKCVDCPKNGKEQRKERRKAKLRKRKGRL